MTNVKKESILIGLYKGTWDQRDFERFQIWDIKYPIVFLTDEPFRDVTHIFSFAHHIPKRIIKLAQRRNIKIYTFVDKPLPYKSNWKMRLLQVIYLVTTIPTRKITIPIRVRYGDDLLTTENIVTDEATGWVFIDQAIGHDSENVGRFSLDHIRESYERDILKFLDKFKTVTIAGHPRNFDTHLGKYPIRHGITSDLIKKSKGIVSHYSTSIKFAARCHKPIIILSTRDLDRTYCCGYIHGFADWLGVSVHYPDDFPYASEMVMYTVEKNNCMTLPETIENIIRGSTL